MTQREEYEAWFRASYGQEPMPRTSPAHDFCWAGYKAGASSRDAEVAELKRKLNEPVLLSEWQQLEKKRDQLRKDVERLNKLVIEAKQAFDGVNVDSRWFDRGMAILDEALAATEPNP